MRRCPYRILTQNRTIASLTVSLALLSTAALLLPLPAAGQDRPAPPELRYSFKMSWPENRPAFVEELFPQPRHGELLVLTGQMAPRGSLVLWGPRGDAAGKLVLRGEDTDITPSLTVAGAQYRRHRNDADVKPVAAAELPKIKVLYEPGQDQEITASGDQGCILLFQVGDGKAGEWAEGHWTVTLRFDPTKLGATLVPAGTGARALKLEDGRTVATYQFRFTARNMTTAADRHNWLYYRFRDFQLREDAAERAKALAPLTELIEAYPTEANLLYARAKLLAAIGRYDEATEDGERIKQLLAKGTLRTAFMPMLRQDRTPPDQTASFVDGMIQLWKQQAAAKTGN